MNRTLKDATVKRYYYETHDELRTHLNDFVSAYNYARRLKTLKGLTPYEFICKIWTKEPSRFTLNPHHQMPGLGTVQRLGVTLPLPTADLGWAAARIGDRTRNRGFRCRAHSERGAGDRRLVGTIASVATCSFVD
jgi:Integrase core domain